MTHVPSEPYSTEIVANGTTVEWLYLNLTADSHPFHTHLAHFEVMGRQPFDAVGYAEALAEAREAAVPTPRPRRVPGPRPLHARPRGPRSGDGEGPEGHGDRQPERDHPDPPPVRPADRGPGQRAPLRLPLPHPRARGERDDAPAPGDPVAESQLALRVRFGVTCPISAAICDAWSNGNGKGTRMG